MSPEIVVIVIVLCLDPVSLVHLLFSSDRGDHIHMKESGTEWLNFNCSGSQLTAHQTTSGCLCIKTSLRPKPFIRENVFRLHTHFHANESHSYMKGFARGLVLKSKHKLTVKWPAVVCKGKFI